MMMVMFFVLILISIMVACSFRVMLLFICCRGWVEDGDVGNNDNYYLYIVKWYRFISPVDKWSDLNNRVFRMGVGGYVGMSSVSDVGGEATLVRINLLKNQKLVH